MSLKIVIPRLGRESKVYLDGEDMTQSLSVKSIRVDEVRPDTLTTIHLECCPDEVELVDFDTEPTKDMVRGVLKELSARRGPKAIFDLFRECDANSLADLHPDHYGFIIDEARKLMPVTVEQLQLTPEQIGEASSLLSRRGELQKTLNMLDNASGKQKRNPLMRVSVGSTTQNQQCSIPCENIRDYMVQELDRVELRLKELFIDLSGTTISTGE